MCIGGSRAGSSRSNFTLQLATNSSLSKWWTAAFMGSRSSCFSWTVGRTEPDECILDFIVTLLQCLLLEWGGVIFHVEPQLSYL